MSGIAKVVDMLGQHVMALESRVAELEAENAELRDAIEQGQRLGVIHGEGDDSAVV